jgi:hypothetical protein
MQDHVQCKINGIGEVSQVGRVAMGREGKEEGARQEVNVQ